MPDPKRREEAAEWLRYAREDLEAAAILVELKPKQALFHAQQAVEKALKGYLVLRDFEYPFTHSLTVLADLCVHLEESLRAEVSPAIWLTQFAVRFRYPGGPEDPGIEEASVGLADAERAVEAITGRVKGGGD
jgi:HEPN domain-containing protein